MGLFGKFFEIFIGFCFLYVEAIIYGGIFRSNCENFESKDDRNRGGKGILFFVKFSWFFHKRALIFFSIDDVCSSSPNILYSFFPLVFLILSSFLKFFKNERHLE